MSTGYLAVPCIELSHRGGQGPLGCVRVYVLKLLHTGGLVRCIEHGSVCRGLHWDSVHEPDLRLVLLVRQVAVAACMSLS